MVDFGTISVTEASTGQIYRASTVYGHNFDNPLTFRSSMAYVTGTHSYKTGFSLRVRGNGPTWNNISVNGDMNYTFLNGVPRSVTLFATPIEQQNDIKGDLGIFAQDSWAMNRMTVNYGVRYDYLHAACPAQHLAAGRFVPERNFAPVKNAPNWKDINPRIGVSYDLFGDGKTAVKATVGRYISGGSLASNVNPVNTSVNSATRTWNDAIFGAGDSRTATTCPTATSPTRRPTRNAVRCRTSISARSIRPRRSSTRKCSRGGASVRTTGASAPASSAS